MDSLTDSIPADLQRKIDDEDMTHVLLEFAGMEPYSDALNFAGSAAKGQVRSMIWQAVHQHLLVRRRNMCIQAGQNFYEVEKKAEAALKRMKVKVSPELAWMLVYAHTMKTCIDEPGMWEKAQATIGSWQSQTSD